MIVDSHKYGALTELMCAAELIKHDWHVAIPIITHSAIDLIAYREDRFVSIQVKSGTHLKHGYARINKKMDKYEGVDFIICYDVHNRRWFIFPYEELKDRHGVTLSPNRYARNCDNWALIR